MTKFLNNADIKGYIAQTAVTSYLLKADSTGRLVAAIAGTDYQAPTTALLPSGGTAGQILAKIDGTNYNTQWIDNFAQQIKYDVKLGTALTKGTPVYVSSANGTNIIVSASSNASEATSSKTLGLLETGGVLNDIVKVVSDGLLSGLNTSAATIGDPVWLGVNGGLIFGLANKPSAPAHLVYIGAVTRVHAVNGEIFIKVQNGFELDELHNVALSSSANNEGLFYDSATSLWKNKTIAAVLGYTPANGANYLPLSGGTLTGDLTLSGTNPRLYFTDTDNNPDYFISNTDGTFTVYDVTNSVGRFKIYSGGNAEFSNFVQANGKLFIQRASNGADTLLQFKNEVGADRAYIKFGGTDEELAFYAGAGATRNMIIGSDGAMGFNYPTLAVRSFMFRALSGRPLAVEVAESGGVHSVYIRPNPSGRHLITSNYLSGGVYLPLSLSSRENDGDFVLNAGNIGIGTATTDFKVNISAASTTWTGAPAIAFLDTVVTSDARNWLIGNVATSYGNFVIASSTVQGGSPTTPRLTIFRTGQLQLNTYTSATSFSGTAAGYLAFDSSGNVITVAGVAATDNTKLPLAGGTTTGIVTFGGSNNSTDNVRFQNTDGNYAYIRQTAASNSNNVWYDGTLGATMWYAWDNPGSARTAGVYTQHIFGTGRGTSNEAVTINRGAISGTNSSGTITYSISRDGDISLGGGSSSVQSTLASGLTAIRFPNQYSSGYTDAGVKLYIFNSGTTIQGFTAGPAYDLQYHSSGSDSGRHAFYVANTEIIRFNKTSVVASGQLSINNGASNALSITTAVADGTTRDGIYLYENSGQASGRQAISWYNGGQSYYKARIWTEVGGGYGATQFGIDVANDARTVATRLYIRNGDVYINNSAYANGNRLVENAGTWGINVTGSSRSLLFSGDSAKAFLDGLWAGGGSYPGYQFTGGNSRFGFSSTGGVVDVYADGNFYATDSSYLVWHQGNLTNLNQLSNGPGYITSSATVAGLNTEFLGTGSTNISSGYSRVIRNENSNGGNPTYAPVLHLAASDTMWQIAGAHGGSTTLVWRSGYAGTWSTPWWNILHSGNVSSYALPISGGTLTGTTLVNGGSSFVASGYNNSGGYAMNNAGQYWGLMWNYSTNDWRLGYGSQTAQVGWNLRWDASGNAWANTSMRAPIFYDSDDTGFYGDFASTSRINTIRANKMRADTNGDMGSSGWWAHDPYGYSWGQPHGSFRSLEVSSSGDFSNEPAMFRIHQWGSGAAEFWKPKGTILYLRETPGGGSTWFTRFEVQGAMTTTGDFTVGSGGASNIFMVDSDEGTRRIHCNSNRIGFLNQSDGWGSWCDDDGGWQSSASISAGSQVYANGHFRPSGDYGLYSQDYGGVFRRNTNSYGTWESVGYAKNGWGGYVNNNNYIVSWMLNTSGDFGFLTQNGNWWNLFYNNGNNCWGIGTDNTYSGDGFRCIKYGSAQYGWTTWSDRRAKENISTITGALDKVLNMRGVYFNYIIDEAKNKRVGFIAQELQQALPEAVRYAEEIDEYNVEYGQIVSVLAEAVKEHYAKTVAQQIEIDALKIQLQTLLN